MMLAIASTRLDIANYVGDLFGVYIALILIYILANLVFAFGLRPGYSRALDAVLGFLRDVCEPYLRIFRRLIPAIGDDRPQPDARDHRARRDQQRSWST